VFLACQKLGGPIEESSYLVGHLPFFPCLFPGHAEIDEFEVVKVGADLHRLYLRGMTTALDSQHDIGRLQIPVQKAAGVQVVHGLNYLKEELLDSVLFLAF